MTTGYTGAPIHEGISAPKGTGEDPAFSLIGLREMVVVDVKYVDDVGNRSRAYPEYTVRDIATGQLYPGTRRVQIAAGVDDGDDNILQPSDQPLPGVARTQKFNKFKAPAIQTNGDRVLCGFIEGSSTRCVILGVLAHSKMKYGAKKADGKRRLTTHAGTSVEFKKDGAYVITRGATSITVGADQNVTIEHKTGARFRIADDGDIEVKPANGKALYMGDDIAALDRRVDGAVHGSGQDPFTGATYFALGNTSSNVIIKKK